MEGVEVDPAPPRQPLLARSARAGRGPHAGDHPRASGGDDRGGTSGGMTGPIPTDRAGRQSQCRQRALFNALTGARQKVGNYPGVTVERNAGHASFADGRPVELVDLPGAYSLDPASPDEAVTRDVVLGKQEGERLPDALIVVVDASNLDNHLRFALQLIALGLPTVIALNMVDLAERDGLSSIPNGSPPSSACRWSPTVAVRKRGLRPIARRHRRRAPGASGGDRMRRPPRRRPTIRPAPAPRARDRAWPRRCPKRRCGAGRTRVDAVVLHPVAGPLILLGADVRHVPGGVRLGRQRRPTAIESGFAALQGLANRRSARRLPALADRRRADRRRRRGDRLPAADPDPVPLHPAARSIGLHGPRRVPDGPADGAASACRAAPSFRCCRASPAPCRASWRRGRSTIRRTG